MLPPHADPRAACVEALARLRAGEIAPMAAWLRGHLFEHILPFWERHAFDPQGGLCTCVDDAGTILSRDKWLWSQWRAVWVFSRVHRVHEPDRRWLDRAGGIVAFCRRHGWDPRGNGWALVLAQDGRMVRGHESIYTDAFAVTGLTEFFRASGDGEALALAEETARAALAKLAAPVATIPHFPYPIPAGAKPHGLPMIWSLVLAEFAEFAARPSYAGAAAAMAAEIFRDFHRQDCDLVLEFVGADGGALPPPHGTVVVPGHAIEDMWFQIHVARHLHLGSARVAEACRLILRHLEIGWDHAGGGGVLLAVDSGGRQPVAWNFAESKLWWPQTEALYAALLGWAQTGRSEFLDWYERLWRVCLDHFVDWSHGEWRQKLNRDFRPIAETIALPVKDPFHLPRSLMLQIELLTRMSHTWFANDRRCHLPHEATSGIRPQRQVSRHVAILGKANEPSAAQGRNPPPAGKPSSGGQALLRRASRRTWPVHRRAGRVEGK
jgi:N-acylglucosamine 2-epimerase